MLYNTVIAPVTKVAIKRADDYSKNPDGSGSSLRALVVCNVLLGNAFYITRTNEKLKEPPTGYDSVRKLVSLQPSAQRTHIICRSSERSEMISTMTSKSSIGMMLSFQLSSLFINHKSATLSLNPALKYIPRKGVSFRVCVNQLHTFETLTCSERRSIRTLSS